MGKVPCSGKKQLTGKCCCFLGENSVTFALAVAINGQLPGSAGIAAAEGKAGSSRKPTSLVDAAILIPLPKEYSYR